MSRSRVIGEQATYINILQKQLVGLREENILLKETLKQVSTEWNVEIPSRIVLTTDRQRLTSWSDRTKHFAGMRSQLLKTVIQMSRNEKNAIHQKRICDEAKKLYMNLKDVGNDTLTARLREMCNPMMLLNRPKLGFYYPSKKAFELQ